jgi:hypothetical protein
MVHLHSCLYPTNFFLPFKKCLFVFLFNHYYRSYDNNTLQHITNNPSKLKIFSIGVSTLKTGRLLSFLLLAAFLTFILSHSYNPISSPFLHTLIKLIIDDGKEENFQLKNHEKKHSIDTTQTINDFNLSVVFILSITMLLSSIFFRFVYMTPVFFQSNYVICTPLLSNFLKIKEENRNVGSLYFDCRLFTNCHQLSLLSRGRNIPSLYRLF